MNWGSEEGRAIIKKAIKKEMEQHKSDMEIKNLTMQQVERILQLRQHDIRALGYEIYKSN